MRPLLITALFVLAIPALAQTPPTTVPTSPAPSPSETAAAPVPAAATGPPASLLDSLAGKPQIVGLTETSGRRFLGRIVSGDHGMYVVQTFHFAGPPHVTSRTVEEVSNGRKAHTQTITVGSGRNRRRVRVTTYTSVPGKKTRRTLRTQTETALPDDQAVSLLLKGVAGATMTPLEIVDARQLVATTDVKYLQALSPPAKKQTATLVSTAPFPAAPAATARTGWTITTLWPTDAKLENTQAPGGKKQRHHKH